MYDRVKCEPVLSVGVVSLRLLDDDDVDDDDDDNDDVDAVVG